MHSEGWVDAELCEARNQHLLRDLRTYPQAGGIVTDGDRRFLNFSSNDYLDLAHRPEIVDGARRALEQHGCGAGSSRLVTGSLPVHEQLETVMAEHKGYPAALVFGSGFLANAGIIPALVGREDCVFADKLVHASMIDGILLSRAKLVRFRHNDVDHLAHQLSRNGSGRRLIITESVFSMDGDLAPLTELAPLAVANDAMLMVDEAHASGVFGPNGSGLVHAGHLQDAVNVSMGTFSKALGNYGGFAACSGTLKSLLVNRARAFIYTTALPPAVAGGCLAALRLLADSPGLGDTLLRRVAVFRNRLRELGFDTGDSASQIVPVRVGDSGRALALSARLRDRGILAVAIRPPTVPAGTARLRLSVTLAHSDDDLAWTTEQLTGAAREEGLL